MPEEGAADALFGVRSSLSGRSWVLSETGDADIAALRARTGRTDMECRLLAARGVGADEAERYLAPTLRDHFPDPSSLLNMDAACSLVFDALLAGRKVTVFADYDVDGGTSAAMLVRYFRAWGRALDVYVPDRLTEGYGPSPAAFKSIKESGAELVITVDCGAAAKSALEAAAAMKLPVVVLDHHLMSGDPPPCAALVNPNQSGDESGCGHLAAAGVTYVFLAGLNRLARQRGEAPHGGLPDILEWLDLAALGTICDMVALKGFNRAVASQGLKVMSRTSNPGLQALCAEAGQERARTVYDASFVLGPRLNAGGRIGEPWLASTLLSTDDCTEASDIAARLQGLNEERRAVEAAMLDQARRSAARQLEGTPDTRALVVAGEGWHPGVAGIVAGRLKDSFGLPSIVIGHGEGLGALGRGSARSVKGVNIGAALSAASAAGVIQSGGGHAMAGGLSLDPSGIGEFMEWLQAHLQSQPSPPDPVQRCDVLLSPAACTLESAALIAGLGPFGMGAPEPVVGLRDAEVSFAKRMGANHLRLRAGDSSGGVEAVAWRCADEPMGEALLRGGRFHLLGRLRVNSFRGTDRPQFELVDAAPA